LLVEEVIDVDADEAERLSFVVQLVVVPDNKLRSLVDAKEATAVGKLVVLVKPVVVLFIKAL